MKYPPHHLREYRKKTPVSQSDIAFLLEKKDSVILSRRERGLRAPSLEIVFLYHMLFDTPILTFFEEQWQFMREKILLKLQERIDELRKRKSTAKIKRRVVFLTEVLTRLSKDNTQ
jgi:transcriptional regulator with XRE-family HTH domain